MNIIKGFSYGMRAYSKAIQLIFSKGLAWFFVFPLILNIILFWIGTELISNFSEYIKQFIDNYISKVSISLFNNEFIKTGLMLVVNIILKITYFFAFAFFGGYIIIASMSPIFSWLSERTEKILTGEKSPFSLKQLIKDVIRGFLIVIRNISLELIIGLLLFILSFIPLVGLITPVIMFMVTSYFYGFSFLDYAIERKRMNVSESVKYMRGNKGVVMGNGFLFALSLLIPFCGVLLSGFIAIISVVAGTITVVEYSGNKRY